MSTFNKSSYTIDLNIQIYFKLRNKYYETIIQITNHQIPGLILNFVSQNYLCGTPRSFPDVKSFDPQSPLVRQTIDSIILHDLSSDNFEDMAQLPDYPPMVSPDFHWGSLDSAAFGQALDSAYLEVAHWRKNCLDVPHGLMGKQFVSKLARLFLAVGEGSALEFVALKAIFFCLCLVSAEATSHF